MQYAVTAIRRLQSVSMVLEASDLADARRQAEAQGCAVLGVKPVASRRTRVVGRGPAFALLQFNQSLLILLKAGLSVVEAIETLADRESRSDRC